MTETRPGVTRILIVDDHVILREGVVSLLEAQPDFSIVGEAGTVAEAISMAAKLNPDLVLMDYGLPDGTGLEATTAILKVQPETKIVFLTVHQGDEELFSAIRSGAKGYLPKNISASEMVRQLRGLARGDAAMSSDIVGRILAEFAGSPEPVNDDAFEQLTRRELEVLQELAHGATNREIADKLYISVNTVKNHVHHILEKLDVSDRREAARRAAEHGLT
jgi:DNA-binding NarL/FixJ family response regulator